MSNDSLLGMGDIENPITGMNNMLDEANVMESELSGLGKQDPKEVIDAITNGVREFTAGLRKDKSMSGTPIQDVILILGGAYLLYKILDVNVRE